MAKRVRSISRIKTICRWLAVTAFQRHGRTKDTERTSLGMLALDYSKIDHLVPLSRKGTIFQERFQQSYLSDQLLWAEDLGPNQAAVFQQGGIRGKLPSKENTRSLIS